MNSQSESVSFLGISMGSNDPIHALIGYNHSNSTNEASTGLPPQTHFCKFYQYFMELLEHILPIFLILIFLLFLVYEVVIACYDCGFEHNNLGWIRASFFINIPFLFGISIHTAIKLKTRTVVLKDVFSMIILYMLFVFFYSVSLGFYFEYLELDQIGNALNNVTHVESLPCSVNYYQQIICLKFFNWIFSFASIAYICLGYASNQSKSKTNAAKRCDWLICLIINKCEYLLKTIFQYHVDETIIEQF